MSSTPQSNPFQSDINSLEELVDLISEVINCPVTLEDVNHRLLAYSSHEDNTDPARISTIISRRVPEKVINSLWKADVIPSLLTSEDPIRVSQISQVGLGDRVAISIRKNEEVLGYIWALEVESKITNEKLILLKQAAKVAKNLLLKIQVKKTKKEAGYQEFFRKLLTGHIKTEMDARESFQQLAIIPPSTFSILVFSFEKMIDENIEKQISYILETTQQMKVVFYQMNDQELTVLGSVHSKNEKQELINFIHTFSLQMRERFNIDPIDSALGNVYTNFTKISKSYREAKAVLELKTMLNHELSSIFSYEDLGLYQFIRQMNHDSFTEAPPALQKLEKYDLQNKSELMKTLEVFLDHDGNLNEAAKVMHIHVNTLTYRLKRISEIGEIDLKDFNQKAYLFLYLKFRKTILPSHL